MRNGNKYHIKPTGNPGDDPGLSRNDRFEDDFEREAFEGLERNPGWKRDVNELKSSFRRKWGIPLLPVYVRFSMYTLATAVCLVFVFIISEKWYGLKDDLQQNQLAEEVTVNQKSFAGDSVVSLLPAEQEQSETFVTATGETVNKVMAEKQSKDFEDIIVSDEVADVSKTDVYEPDDRDAIVSTKNEASGKDLTVLADVRTDAKESGKKKDKAGQGEGMMLGGNAASELEKAEESDNNRKREVPQSRNLPAQTPEYRSYPQDYMSELTVVDYTQIRTTTQLDGLSAFSSVDARYENQDSKNSTAKTLEQSAAMQQIPYMDFLQNAMKKFKGKMYGAALADYEVILKTYPDDLNALFYGGICNYHLKRNDKALDYLEKVISDKTEVFFPEAEWYKALTLIQAERKDEARQLLKKITEEGGFYSEKAAMKLGELK